jgi:2'-5' RNA ligase
MRPNWFIAFPVDGAFVPELPALPPCFRAFPSAELHMTLAFLGACGETVAHRALAALDERLARAPVGAFPISFGAVVPMGGSRQGYTALSALLERGRDRATEILTAHRDPLYEAAGRKPERRPPKPHAIMVFLQRSPDRNCDDRFWPARRASDVTRCGCF